MKIVGLILLIIVAYFAWRFAFLGDGLVVIGNDTGKRISARLKDVIPNESLVIEIDNNDRENSITEISMPRSLAEILGASPPDGFTAELLPVSDSEKNDQEAVRFVDKFNAETLRWVGQFALSPNIPSELRIPAKVTSNLSGRINFQYEAKVGFGGSISFFSLTLDTPP